MKTVFRVGMKVYDQLMFPDKEGVVLTTNYIPEKIFDEDDFDEDYVHPYPILVEFGSEDMLYTKDGDCEMCSVKTLSTKPYKVELQGFEQKAPAPSYEEIRAESLKKVDYVAVLNGIELPDEKIAKAFETLAKLIWLRDYYNEGWQPDWSNYKQTKYTIEDYQGELWCESYTATTTKKILSFKDDKIRDKFLEEQKELLEIAKPLL
ncbi:hypothetical protein [Capnocytophaga bilenii]